MTQSRIRQGVTIAVALIAVGASAPVARAIVLSRAPVQRVAVDPVGEYQWSMTTSGMAVNGTLKVTRSDSTLSATVTSDQTDSPIPATSVKLDGNRLTVVASGDFGEFTIGLDFAESGLSGTYKYVNPNGAADSGPLTIKKSEK